MPTITVTRTGRTWYGRSTYTVAITDKTGNIQFHGFGRTDARLMATVLGPIIGLRPVGPLADILAREIALHEPATGKEWVAKL